MKTPQIFKDRLILPSGEKWIRLYLQGKLKPTPPILLMPCRKCGEMMLRPHRYSKQVACEKCVCEERSERNVATGYCPQVTMNLESEKRRLQIIGSKAHRNHLKEVKWAVPKRNEKGKKYGLLHPRVVEFTVRSPDGRFFTVKNTRKFTKENPSLFDPEDVIFRKLKSGLDRDCKASCGLLSLRKKVGTRLSWKGWTLAI